MDNLVTLLTLNNISDTYIPQSILESYEIPVAIKDEIMGGQFFAYALGGVKLQVLECDYERAKKVLEEAGYTIDN